jgi:hypothetical protein
MVRIITVALRKTPWCCRTFSFGKWKKTKFFSCGRLPSRPLSPFRSPPGRGIKDRKGFQGPPAWRTWQLLFPSPLSIFDQKGRPFGAAWHEKGSRYSRRARHSGSSTFWRPQNSNTGNIPKTLPNHKPTKHKLKHPKALAWIIVWLFQCYNRPNAHFDCQMMPGNL